MRKETEAGDWTRSHLEARSRSECPVECPFRAAGVGDEAGVSLATAPRLSCRGRLAGRLAGLSQRGAPRRWYSPFRFSIFKYFMSSTDVLGLYSETQSV